MTYSPPRKGFPRSRDSLIKELQAACERWADQVDELEVRRDELAAKNRLQAQTLDKVVAEREHYKQQALHVSKQLSEALMERDRLRKALEYYADVDSWTQDDWGVSAVIEEYGDAGKTAREALNKADTNPQEADNG